MNVALGDVAKNLERAKTLIEKAMKDSPDVIALPELWDVGFFPRENLTALSDDNGTRVKREIGSLAKKHSVNIVAGSVADKRGEKVYNTAYIFDREGEVVARYDKAHLFSPMGEDSFFQKGDGVCTFALDGVKCGIIICYDLRFPELSRALALEGINVLFLPAEWPDVRISHFGALALARSIENQMFVAASNGCGTAGDTRFGGKSRIISPLGEVLAQGGEESEIITAECDTEIIADIKKSINVFCDRRADLYNL